ncbi:MAG: hypothetical protein OXU33_13300 [Gemmatimonadota bacterium]|nr:hypothetical protein [Gemmatimonadota bacterium]MDE3006060.1 hypothetical protein [Gemmatimonadota bacterium]MDE3015041.1 hypothetical protein [Gemmatimonadota bacterium]
MERRVERKLQEVVVAQYSWRHEAEFAAGFLSDAGIPYRLQIDDPSLGISVSAAATLWVLGIDEVRARDVLDINEQQTPQLSSPRSSKPPPQQKAAHPSSPDPGAVIATEYAPIRADPYRPKGAMPLRARALSILGGVGIAAIGQAAFPQWSTPGIEVALTTGGAILIIVGLIGWAPSFLKDWLSALSGLAP